MDARTPRTHLTPTQTRPEPAKPPVATQRHHTEHSSTQGERLLLTTDTRDLQRQQLDDRLNAWDFFRNDIHVTLYTRPIAGRS